MRVYRAFIRVGAAVLALSNGGVAPTCGRVSPCETATTALRYAPSVGRALPSPGDVVAGKYRVIRRLAQGGMGVVFECEHDMLAQRVALKVLTTAREPELVRRFVNEARAAAAITSDHVVRVFDVGIDREEPYLVMELLSGSDLQRVVAERGALPVEETVDTIMEVLEALSEAHALGIVHRDLKPANLFLTHRRGVGPCVKILDFGVSKTKHAAGGSTLPNEILGSPQYMAPEQLRDSAAVDARADIWSIGIVAIHLLAGRPPFDGESVFGVINAVLQREIPALRTLRPDAPEGLEAVVARCVAREPANRFASARDLAIALAPWAGKRGKAALSKIYRRETAPSTGADLDPALAPRAAPSELSVVGWQTTTPRPHGARSIVSALIIAAVAVLATGVTIKVLHHAQPSVATAARIDPPPAAVSPPVAPAAPAAPSAVASAVAPASSSAAPNGNATTHRAPPKRVAPASADPAFDPFSGPRR